MQLIQHVPPDLSRAAPDLRELTPKAPSRPYSPSVRVLHVVENLHRGAVENWLLRMLAHARRLGLSVDWTFYCLVGNPGEMEERARTLGAGVIHSPVPIGRKFEFAHALRTELLRGRYQVLHCHDDLISALYLFASAGTHIRRRIVHVHNADENVLTPSRLKQHFYREPLRFACLNLADRIIGISNHTLDTFLAGRVRRLGRDVVHYYGVDSTPFLGATADRVGFRRQLGYADDALILLFAGRLVSEKNPVFAVDVLASLRKIEPTAVAVFAGVGSQERSVVGRAQELGVESGVRMLGWRKDLAEIMTCSDWFILPHPEHPMEGFGLAIVEAQLAGLPMLLSHGIPDDPLLRTASFRRLSLCAGPAVWANAAVELLTGPASSRAEAARALGNSPFAMDIALADLLSLHGEECGIGHKDFHP